MRLLIDISTVIYRSVFKLNLTNAEGRPTSAIYGVLKALNNYAELYRPEEIIICWDGGYKYRKELYPQYKANRHHDVKIKNAITYQSNVLKEMLAHLPIIQVFEQDCEADDIIAIIANFCRVEKLGIVTGDHDLYCLAHEQCRIINPDGSRAKLTMPPGDYLTSKILVGDTSDNVKGILNVGPVTAKKLIDEHKTLDEILKYAERYDRLGDMTYRTSKEIIERNKLLLTPGLIVPKDKEKKILDQYRFQRLELKLNSVAFRTGLMKQGIISIVSRLSGWLMPFKKMQITRGSAKARLEYYEKTKAESNAKAKEENENKDNLQSTTESKSSHSSERLKRSKHVCKVNKRYPKIIKTTGRATDVSTRSETQRRAAKALESLRAQKFVSMASPGDRLGARRALSNRNGQARNGRAGMHTSSVLDSEEILPREYSSKSILSVLQSYQSEEKWKWLKSQPTSDLYRVKDILNSAIAGKKVISREDAAFLIKLEDAYQFEMPVWMKTKDELKTNAKRIIKNQNL